MKETELKNGKEIFRPKRKGKIVKMYVIRRIRSKN